MKKVLTIRTKKVNWTNDSPEGRSSPTGTSMHLLIKWLLVPGNYSKWRGDKDHQGRKKKETAAEIANFINDGGVMEKRTTAQVQAQMARLETNMRAAYDFSCTETGAGLLESDKVSFDEAVRKKCSYYFDLRDIMCDRASVKPKATTDEGLDSSDEEEIVLVGEDLSDESIAEESAKKGVPGGSDGSTSSGSGKKSTASTSSGSAKKPATKRKKGSIASGGRNVISLLDDESNAKLNELTSAKEALARAKICKLEQETEEKRLDKVYKDERRDIERVMYKMQQLKTVREANPDLTEEQICDLFPVLKDIIAKMKP